MKWKKINIFSQKFLEQDFFNKVMVVYHTYKLPELDLNLVVKFRNTISNNALHADLFYFWQKNQT